MLKNKFLFELPIYRISERKYYLGFLEYLSNDESGLISRSYLREKFGGDWQYNEIIGFLRFYQYDSSQIRCEYWDTKPEIKRKTRTKIYIKKSDNFVSARYHKNENSVNIAKTLGDSVKEAALRLKKGRFLDSSMFENTLKFADWKKILK